MLICFILINPTNSKSQCGSGGNENGILGGGGLDSALSKVKTLADWFIELIRSGDPNQITGNKGYTEKKWVSIHDQLDYTIEFENDGEIASGDAQNVYIHFPVPTNSHVNINSFMLGNFGFGKYNFQVPPNTTAYTNRLDLRDSLNLYVDVTAGIDIINHEFFWIFKSIDPQTGSSPINGNGFLPPSDTGAARLSDTTGKGQGFVTFFASPQSYLKTQDTIAAQATIVFDINDPVSTNTWVNTVDAAPPVSSIVSGTATDNIIKLNWTGQDDPGGSGVRDYDLYVSENGDIFKLCQSNIKDTFTTYTGTPGSLYCFFTLATDNTGNKEALKKNCEVSVLLNLGPLPVTWLYFEGQPQNNDVALHWGTVNEMNTKNFIIERSFNASDFTAIDSVPAINSPLTNNYNYIDKNALLLKTSMLYYRLKQMDIDGKFIYSKIIHFPIPQNLGVPNVTAYPNPFNQTINLKILNVTTTDKTNDVSLYSVDGKLVYKRNLGIVGPATVLLQDLPALVPGEYILTTSINGKLYTVKMIKQTK